MDSKNLTRVSADLEIIFVLVQTPGLVERYIYTELRRPGMSVYFANTPMLIL